MPYEARVIQSHTSNGSVANSSNVTVTFQIRRTDYAMVGYNYEGNAYWRINCDGQSTGNKYFTFDWGYHPQNQWWTVGSHTFTVAHNGDGSKHIGFDGYYYTGISPSDLGASGSATLTKIPRYANITSFKNTATTVNNATFYWTADSKCDVLQYSLNNGSTWSNASGSTFSISGLSPGTNYNIKIRVRRTDSGLYTTSNSISFTTKSIARISNSSLSMNIGGSLSLSFSDYGNNKSFLRFYAQKTDGNWQQIATVSNIQASSYSWNLSSHSSTLYSLCPNSNSLKIKVICGVSLNGKEYTNTVSGTAKVTNSNPAFSNFTFQNTDSKTVSIVGNTQNMISLFGNLRITIANANKAVAKNSATMKYYNIVVSSGNTVVSKKSNYSLSDINVDIGSLQSAGTYTIRIDAVDSRGNASGVVSKTLVVYPYHTPAISASIDRLNGFEAETSLKLTSLISKINIAGANKNSIQNLEYRYAESGKPFPETYTQLNNYTTSESGEDFVISISEPQFLTLDINKTYIFEFKVSDKVTSYTITPNANQGVSAMNIMDNGNILMGVTPDERNVKDTKANLLVQKDIKAKDRYVMEQIDKRSSLDASDGGIEIPEGADLNNYKTVGNYYCPLNTTVKTLKNCPTNYAFTMEVTYGTGNDYPKQIIYEYFGGGFERYFESVGSKAWKPWGSRFNSNNSFTVISNAVKSLYLLMHPVGSIVMTTSNSNPGNTFGGTWQAWGSGRVPVGVDTNQTEFNSSNKTGGSKTVSHHHTRGSLVANIGAVDNDTTSIGYDATNKGGVLYDYAFSHGNLKTNIPASRVNHATTISGLTADTQVTNLQPYVTCYMWRRTA